jgi:hypothetical protein
MIIIKEAVSVDEMSAAAEKREAVERDCKMVAKQLGATIRDEEDKFIIEGTLSGWFKYFLSQSECVNLNTAKVYVVTTYPFYDNEPEIEMYVGDCDLSVVLHKRRCCFDMELEVTVSTMTVDELLQDSTPCWIEVGKDEPRFCHDVTRWFYMENHHQKVWLIYDVDLHRDYKEWLENELDEEAAKERAALNDVPF